MPIDQMFKKAYDLVKKRKAEYIGDGAYNVVGAHGTYTVAQKIDGTVNCNCPGFLRRGRCSHSLAVMMLTQPTLLKTVEREVSKALERAESTQKRSEVEA